MTISPLKNHAKYFKVLGHAKRLEIIYLLQGHELTVGQVCQMTSLRQATVSQHLIILKQIGIVSQTRRGKEIYYLLSSDKLVVLSIFLDQLTRVRPLASAEPIVIDPICHMSLTPSSAAYDGSYDGVKHYFCGKGCKKEFYAKHKI